MMKALGNIQYMAVLLCLVTTLWSCSEEMEYDGTVLSSDAINFDSGFAEEWNGTRSVAEKNSIKHHVQKFDNAELYLHTFVTASIEEDSPYGATRASSITNSNMTDYKFGVDAYVMLRENETDPFVFSTAEKYIIDQEVYYDKDLPNGGGWTYSPVRYWPNDEDYLLKFIGFAPYRADGMTITRDDKTAPVLAYTVPDDVSKQEDLLLHSLERSCSDKSAVAFDFKHILTAVKFTVGDSDADGNGNINGKIHSIALKGVHYEGTFDMVADPSGWEWTVDETKSKDFSQSLEQELGENPTAGAEITLDPQTFMMMPQEIPDGAYIEVVYSEGDYGLERTLTAPIGGTIWPVGQTVNYKISASKIEAESVFDIGITEQEISNYNNTVVAASGKYTVESYVLHNGEKFPKTWDWGFDENFNKKNGPSWLKVVKEKKPNTEIETYTYTLKITGRTGVDSGHPQNVWLQAQGEKGITVPYNLSHSEGNADIIEETANCYIVNAAGTYSFPLVYGNAIKNDATNESAYIFGGTNDVILHSFVNHANKPITSPWIANNENADGTKIKPHSVELLWQDVKGLITSVQLVDQNGAEVNSASTVDAESYRIKFTTIGQTGICQGNAVIAVRDANNNVLWSWHIWVTDWNSGNGRNGAEELKNVTRTKDYTMMSVNLGWCDGPLRTYEAREKVTIYFKQEYNDEIKTITIHQSEDVAVSHGSAPFYQWGRKDPMIPAQTSSSTYSKTCYDINGNTVSLATANWGTRLDVPYLGILNPMTFCYNTHMENKYYNLWGASSAGASDAIQSQSSIKTIYDPCPAGYKVPVSDMFRAFTQDGKEANLDKGTEGNLLGDWDALLFGRHFPTENGDAVFFPVTNYRNSGSNTADIVNVSDGCYWSAIPSGSNLHIPYSLSFNRSLVNPQANSSLYRATGSAIRPVKDE